MSGRAATETVIPGRHALCVGNPKTETPEGWSWLPLGELATLGTGHTPSRGVSAYWNGDVQWMGIRDARTHHGGEIWNTAQTITQAGLDNSSARLLPAGTVALSRTASVGYVVQLGREMATSQDFVTWTCSAALDPLFLMRTIQAEGDDIRNFGEGSTHTTIYFPELKALHVRTPPVPEQRRIVAKIDRLSARSKRAREALDRTNLLITRYKQAVLSECLAEAVASSPKVAFEAVLDVLTSGSRDWAQYYNRGSSVFVLAGNIRPLAFNSDPKRFVDPPLDGPDARRSRIKRNDILLTIVGAGTGDVCHVDDDFENYFVCQSVALLRLKNAATAKFYVYWFNSGAFGRGDFEEAMYGAARPHLSFEQIRSFVVPAVNATQGEKIVRRIDHAFAAIDRLAAEVTSAQKLLARLDQAVLAKAFRGELVPQDPNDEPASVLLKRIRAERAAAPAAKRGRRPKAAS